MKAIDLKPSKEVVVLAPPQVQKTSSGLEMPQTDENHRPELGIVVAIGAGKKPVDFKIGDTVIFEKYMNSPVTIGEETFQVQRFKHIMGIVTQKEI